MYYFSLHRTGITAFKKLCRYLTCQFSSLLHSLLDPRMLPQIDCLYQDFSSPVHQKVCYARLLLNISCNWPTYLHENLKVTNLFYSQNHIWLFTTNFGQNSGTRVNYFLWKTMINWHYSLLGSTMKNKFSETRQKDNKNEPQRPTCTNWEVSHLSKPT